MDSAGNARAVNNASSFPKGMVDVAILLPHIANWRCWDRFRATLPDEEEGEAEYNMPHQR
jgi:hypothetical protein